MSPKEAWKFVCCRHSKILSPKNLSQAALENLDKRKDVFDQGDHLRETDVIASLREHIRICPSPGIEMTYHRLKILV